LLALAVLAGATAALALVFMRTQEQRPPVLAGAPG